MARTNPQDNLKGEYLLGLSLPVLLVLSLGLVFYPVSAHTIVHVDYIEIDVGWMEEPPVVGLLNAITIEISEDLGNGVKKGIPNSFGDLEATIRFGGATKTLDINSDPRPGHFFSKILPTRTGTISVELTGEINGIPIDVEIPIEDVESQAVLSFPYTSGTSDKDITSLKNALKSLQQDMSVLKSTGVKTDSSDKGLAYDFAIFGISMGVAGVVLAIFALVKRESSNTIRQKKWMFKN